VYPNETIGEIDVHASGVLELASPLVTGMDFPISPRDVLAAPPAAGAGQGRRLTDIVDEWGKDSFPASDPPANW
jgi:hypothetical protein